MLRRLAEPSPPKETTAPAGAPGGGNRPLPAANREQRHAGTVVHQTLELLSRGAGLPLAADADWHSRWTQRLRQLGLSGSALRRALERVAHSVDTTLSSDQGRWLLAADHDQAHSEWALCCRASDGEIRELVIDRCFIARDTGERWLVDYKTGQPEDGESLADFLSQARLAHRSQLQVYRDALAGLTEEPLRCALFFTSLGRLDELVDLRLAGRQ
jgi:ATP-dependent exoDNAse (exonuclease V) beta subunit